MKQHYIDKKFRSEALGLINQINDIIDEYRADGFVLTVRQLYYQLVARAIIPNTINDYKRTAGLVNDAKLAGLIDWDMLEDRTREFVRRTRWDSPQQILNWDAKNYHEDMWSNQSNRVFVVVEKEALVGVLERTCEDYDVPLLAARGYPSGSVLREFSRDDINYNSDQHCVILHLGDHDPSGIDMTRDLEERIRLFSEEPVKLIRIALNMEQIHKQKPPENPAKTDDPRFTEYRKKHGTKSWELDALSPNYLAKLVASHIKEFIEYDEWGERAAEIAGVKAKLAHVAANWEKIKVKPTRDRDNA